MPVREFTGELDKPKVREFRGQLDRAPSTHSIGPATGSYSDQLTADISAGIAGQPAVDMRQEMHRQVASEVAEGDAQIPWRASEAFHEKSIVPLMAAASSLVVPGSGLLALGAQSLAAGGGGAAGELARQKITREPTDIRAAAQTGLEFGGGTAAGGGIIKGLGALSRRIFSSPLSEPAKAAATFARQEGVPFPLSSAAPGSGAARTQQASRGLLLGDIKTQLDANKVAHFLNNRVGTLTEKAQVFDDAARQGQTFLREVFEPGETAIKNTFAKYTEAVGADAPIPTVNTLEAAQRAADFLERRGQTTGGLYQRLRTILKKAPGTYTPREFDELYGAIIKQSFTSRAGAGGEGRILLEGITKDLDDFGKLSGATFADDLAKAAVTREQFRELRKIPQLERLATEIKGQGGARGTIDWMDSLFSSGNGKALAKLRELNAPLYHDLADAWLARQIDNAAGPAAGGLGRQINGPRLRAWYEQNQPKIKEIFGAPQAKALDNFTQYASHMSGAVERAAKGETFSPFGFATRVGGEIAIAAKGTPLIIPGEAAAFVLARGLSDPKSDLFRVFTEGFFPPFRTFMVKSGELSGQVAASEASR